MTYMTIHLPEPLENSILAAVQSGRFASLDAAIAEAVSLLVQRLEHEEAQAVPPGADQGVEAVAYKPIWELIEEENRSVPSDVWDALPTDLAEQHDHYVYGTPKRPNA